MTDCELEVEEDKPWYEVPGAVTMVAEHLAAQGRDAYDIISVFERPWDHFDDHQACIDAGIEYLSAPCVGDLEG